MAKGNGKLLTPDEVIERLRFRDLGVKNPKASLDYLRSMKRIGFVKINRRILYPENDLEEYIRKNYEPPYR